MVRAYKEIGKARENILGELDRADEANEDYLWDKFILKLLKSGFGNYSECAEADIVEAHIFLMLQMPTNKSPEQKAKEWLKT